MKRWWWVSPAIVALVSVGLLTVSPAQSSEPQATPTSATPTAVVVYDQPPAVKVPRWHRFPSPSSSSPHRLAPVPRMPGRASWYVNPRLGMQLFYAAAGPALRIGNWRNRSVLVCAKKCIRVRLSDWCQCYWKTSSERAIDLSYAAFAALGSPSLGILRVTISW